MDDKSATRIAEATKHVLFTNIAFIQLTDSPIRLDAHALLIEDGGLGLLGPTHRIRGFGPDSAWPVFTYYLDKGPIEYSVTSAQDKSKVMLKSNGKTEPIFGGSILSIIDGPKFFLQSENSKRPLDVWKNVGDIEEVWRQLEMRVARYWRAPYMPHSSYGPPQSTILNATNDTLRSLVDRAKKLAKSE